MDTQSFEAWQSASTSCLRAASFHAVEAELGPCTCAPISSSSSVGSRGFGVRLASCSCAPSAAPALCVAALLVLAIMASTRQWDEQPLPTKLLLEVGSPCLLSQEREVLVRRSERLYACLVARQRMLTPHAAPTR